MTLRKLFSSVLLLTLAVCCTVVSAGQTLAQSEAKPTQTAQDETNLDTQLYLVVGTNQEAESERLPASLDGVIKQLRSSLPFKNYRVAATLINRVKNEGQLSLRWVGGPLAFGAVSPSTPSFSEFRVNSVKLVREGNQQLVRMDGFVFGVRIPIHTSSTVASNAPAAPVFNYGSTGLNTDISVKEGQPVVVGTLNVGPSGDAIILVVSAKRTPQ
jgi:hypothetical protein